MWDMTFGIHQCTISPGHVVSLQLIYSSSKISLKENTLCLCCFIYVCDVVGLVMHEHRRNQGAKADVESYLGVKDLVNHGGDV